MNEREIEEVVKKVVRFREEQERDERMTYFDEGIKYGKEKGFWLGFAIGSFISTFIFSLSLITP